MERFLELVAKYNGVINNIVWGIPMLILIIGTGIFMTCGLKFFQISHLKHWFDETLLAIFKKKSVTSAKEKTTLSQFQALSTALAATIGTGNIAGVATAIAVGGPGAVFWMWISAFFGMMTNFSENVLGIFYRRKNKRGEWSGGAMYYLCDGLGSKKGMRVPAKVLAVLFSVFCMLASFGIGNIAQINTIAGAVQQTFHITPVVTGVVLAVVAALVIIGGVKRIGQVAERLVPFMALGYVLGTLVVVIVNASSVGSVFASIFREAFGLNAVAGGISGAVVKEAMTMGFKRGVFSNEAGLGSSVMVHSASNVKEPVVQGMWGIFEVFFDTMIVCTLTALTILTTGILDSGAEGAGLVGAAFASSGMGAFGSAFVAIAILLFAFTTCLGWSFYGTKAVEYLFGEKVTIIYKVVFVVFIVFSATVNMQLAWDIADTLNALMAIPNLIGVLALSGTVFAITRNYVRRRIKKQPENIEPMLSAFADIQREQADALKQEE